MTGAIEAPRYTGVRAVLQAQVPNFAAVYLFWGASLVASVSLISLLALAVIHASHPLGIDFLVFWTAAQLTLSPDLNAVLYNIPAFTILQGEAFAASEFHPFPYPPTFLLLVAPWGTLPFIWSWLLWNVITFLGLVWSVRYYVPKPQVILLALAPASIYVFFTGQTTFLIAALVIGGLRLVLDRPIVAGGLLAAAMCFKPHLAVLIPVALTVARLWVSLFSAFFISTLIVLASIAVFGADLWLSWIAFLPSFQSGLFERFEQYARFIPSVLFSAMLAGTGFATAMVLQVVAAGVGVAACAWAYSRSRDLALQCAVLLVGTLLTAPYTFNYDLVFVSVAVLILFEYGRSRGFLSGELLVLTCAWLAAMLDGKLGVLAGVTVSPAVVTALLAYLLMRIEREHRTRPLHLNHSRTA